jgi:hypothetical protein
MRRCAAATPCCCRRWRCPRVRLGAATVKVGGVEEPVRNVSLRLTQLFNVTGHPAITIPCGATTDGLPIGAQFVGRCGGTDDLLSVATGAESLLQPVRPVTSSSMLARFFHAWERRLAFATKGPRGAPVRMGHRLDPRTSAGDENAADAAVERWVEQVMENTSEFFALPPTSDLPSEAPGFGEAGTSHFPAR